MLESGAAGWEEFGASLPTSSLDMLDLLLQGDEKKQVAQTSARKRRRSSDQQPTKRPAGLRILADYTSEDDSD